METTLEGFRESPEFKKGRTGEHLVADILRRDGWFVIPSYDYSGEDGDKAPKLEGLKDAFPTPDLDVAKEGKRRWAEVKTKAAATYTKTTNRLEHGIPRRHWDSYQRVQEITGSEVWLFIHEEDTQKVICASIDSLAKVRREYCGVKMSRGGMVFFPRDAFRPYRTLPPPGGAPPQFLA